MAKYIPLDALLEEIDRLEDKLYYEPENFKDVGAKMALDSLKSSLNILEVKEVDLQKEWKEFLKDSDVGFKEIAKHFFELGLRSTITEEDCKLIWNIGDDISYMPEKEFFKELLKRFKAQKGE